jgi:hypothetical protein
VEKNTATRKTEATAASRIDLSQLETPEKHEDDNNKEYETYAPGRVIAPPPAVRPSRQRAHKHQYQAHDQ